MLRARVKVIKARYAVAALACAFLIVVTSSGAPAASAHHGRVVAKDHDQNGGPQGDGANRSCLPNRSQGSTDRWGGTGARGSTGWSGHKESSRHAGRWFGRHSHPPCTGATGGQGTGGQASIPVTQVEAALHAQGSVTNGVLTIPLERTDITGVHIGSVPIDPSFEVNGEMAFQPLGNGQAFMNGDIALKSSELDPFIASIIKNGLTFQAEHQHLYDFEPMVWFVHVRGQGDPVALASAIYNSLSTTTGTPFPQTMPSNPTTPLDADKLEQILHGFNVEVGDDGVVTVYVARRDPIYINGILVNPATNIATNVAFEPLNSSGSQTAVIPDFAMEAGEINSVIGTMSTLGWDIGCLYNQETAETPQLYFSHDFKVGDPYQLAQEVRSALDETDTQ